MDSDQNERNRFENWRKAWDAQRSAWTTDHPETRMQRLDDDAVPRPTLRTRQGIYVTEEMHVRSEAGMPLGELRIRWPFIEPRHPRLGLDPIVVSSESDPVTGPLL